MAKIKFNPEKMGWKPETDKDSERVKKGVAAMRQALGKNEKEKRAGESGLPPGWRNRTFRKSYGLPADASQRFM